MYPIHAVHAMRRQYSCCYKANRIRLHAKMPQVCKISQRRCRGNLTDPKGNSVDVPITSYAHFTIQTKVTNEEAQQNFKSILAVTHVTHVHKATIQNKRPRSCKDHMKVTQSLRLYAKSDTLNTPTTLSEQHSPESKRAHSPTKLCPGEAHVTIMI